MVEFHRFFVPKEILEHGDALEVTGDTLHHIQQVLRLREKTQVLLLDGTGECCLVRLERMQRKSALAKVVRRWKAKETAFPILVIQALPKGDKFDFVLQKGTELGVTAFQPVFSDHTIPKSQPQRNAQRGQRWERIVREAARQSRRYVLPEVRPMQDIGHAITNVTPSLKLVLSENANQPLTHSLPVHPPASAALLIGPEGGLSEFEIDLAKSAGFHPVHLGPRIMRTETVGLAVASILQYHYGDWTSMPE